MKKLIVHMMTGYCGEDAYEPIAVDDNCTNQQIDNICWEMAIRNAESYGHPEEEDEEEFLERLDYSWEEYDPSEHDMYCSGGGSFENEFVLYD